jgi:hypothetical protein
MSQTFTDRIAANRTRTDLKRWLVAGVAALIVAAGLVALGRWTAPSTAHTVQPSVFPLKASDRGPGSIDPSVMPSRGVQQALERIYLGTSSSVFPLKASDRGPGAIDPSAMPSRGVLQTLQHIYLGTPLPRNAGK